MAFKVWDNIGEYQPLFRNIELNPYKPEAYLLRARWYETHGLPDLAAGDAYKALLLSDEIRDASGEYHEDVMDAIQNLSVNALQDSESGCLSEETQGDNEIYGAQDFTNLEHTISEHDVELIAMELAVESYNLLASTLMQCGCLKSSYEFASRGLQTYPKTSSFGKLIELIEDRSLRSNRGGESDVEQRLQSQPSRNKQPDNHTLNELPEQGTVRRILYPWNDYEPDRLSNETLDVLNDRLREVAPKCEVRTISLPLLKKGSTCSEESSNKGAEESPVVKQLGLFALEEIFPYETVLCERSLLTANNRLHDTLCDACSGPLPKNLESLASCDNCDDTIFCSSICASLAQACYHPAVCGKPEFDLVTKDPSPNETSSALYLALLARTFSMSATQDMNPLDLPEVKYLWGDFTAFPLTPSSQLEYHLPFTFKDNIQGPLTILERMDVNIFTSPLAETWIVNTLLAKFRGTASARLNKEGIASGPEVAAVHPIWCLANHSCAPNVQWDWCAEIRFKARGGKDVVRWGPEMEGGNEEELDPKMEEPKIAKNWRGGIKKGEEILNHYCDVDLSVQERREWALGALGGKCMCKRCQWEEK